MPRGAPVARRHRRAVIIGGSMSGLFAAAFLRQQGWDIDVYERSPVELVGRGAGITTHPELLDALQKSGAGLEDLGSDEYLDEETLRCAARMHVGRHARWIVIQLESRGEHRVKDIRITTPETFSEAEITRGIAHLDEVVARARAARRIGRNERCPCGSGLKYKACHERR